ncbi:hypothetical protein VIGAN_08344700 [Vigna angularis var. angularis]|uniref:Uncharacterized protein n=1 Tax=Vigna angularis var. angularis TaxID=157739 RepID=A0A0S3SUN8_PHAAN|nr:hypothetical protein VIGAN_08344700 [Vigna angularis var. angularis]
MPHTTFFHGFASRPPSHNHLHLFHSRNRRCFRNPLIRPPQRLNHGSFSLAVIFSTFLAYHPCQNHKAATPTSRRASSISRRDCIKSRREQ